MMVQVECAREMSVQTIDLTDCAMKVEELVIVSQHFPKSAVYIETHLLV
jgi:hypothetical protein